MIRYGLPCRSVLHDGTVMHSPCPVYVRPLEHQRFAWRPQTAEAGKGDNKFPFQVRGCVDQLEHRRHVN